jgi:hypothetical protein
LQHGSSTAYRPGIYHPCPSSGFETRAGTKPSCSATRHGSIDISTAQCNCVDRQEQTLEIDGELLVELGLRHCFERRGPAQAGVGEYDIEPAIALTHRLDEPVDVSRPAQIGPERETVFAERDCRRLEPVGIIADNDDLRAFAAEQPRGREADTGRAPP